MTTIPTRRLIAAALLALCVALPAQAGSVNKSIKIPAGAQSDGDSTVNGSISVGSGAVLTGDISTVNGTIRVDDDVQLREASTVNGALRLGDGVVASSLSTVNGSIRVGERGNIEQRLEAVNGRISTERGTIVGRGIGNVNGEIELSGTRVEQDVTTVSGDITLADAAVVLGDLVVEKPNMWNFGSGSSRKPRVVIGPGCRVEGTVVLEREVELYISETAEVGGVSGEMNMDDAIRFSGATP